MPITQDILQSKKRKLSDMQPYKHCKYCQKIPIHLASVTEIPTSTINMLTKIQMEFILKGKNPKIKNSTLCNDYKYGALKMLIFFSKVVSLQCSWIKRVFNNNYHQWKLISFYFICQYLGKKL